MEKAKAKTIALVIICFIIGIVLGLFLEPIIFEEEDEGGTWDIFYADLPYKVPIDPANFVDKIDNPYMPLNVGEKLVYEGDTEDGREHIEVWNTNQTKVVMGVTCTVVRDTVSLDGTLVEDTYDWFAQDIHGNVWYFGEESEEYEDGEWTTEGSWEAGIDGAYPGIVMLANPLPGMAYRQEYWEGEAEDMGVVVSVGESLSIDYGTYDDLLVIRDWNPLEPDEVEHKYYAKGIGVIREEVIVGDPEQFDIIAITTV